MVRTGNVVTSSDFISWTPTEMKVYRVYRDTELFTYLLDRYMLFYACMKLAGGCAMRRAGTYLSAW